MAKESGKKSFLDFFKMKELDDDEFDDDLFDEDEEDDDDEDNYTSSRSSSRYNNKRSSGRGNQTSHSSHSSQSYSSNQSYASQNAGYNSQRQASRPVSTASNNRVVDFNGSRPKSDVRGRNEVYVIVPHDTSESQTVADFLKSGKTIVINMEGLELATAQRIIDFIGGACYAIDGSLQAISANIFIAAPNSIEVSGDLREILGASTMSPQLNQF